MIEFRVEYRGSGDAKWRLDEAFENLSEAMDFITRESLLEKWYQHRIVKTTEIEVLAIPPLAEFV